MGPNSLNMDSLLSGLPREDFSKIRNLADRIWRTYRYLPYGNSPRIGRSTLVHQLKHLDEISIRDCKLPSYIFAKSISQLGYESQILVKRPKGSHPYLLVRLAKYNDLVAWTSFHPLNFVCNWLTRRNYTPVKWPDLAQYASANDFSVIKTDENGWEELDKIYEKLRSEL